MGGGTRKEMSWCRSFYIWGWVSGRWIAAYPVMFNDRQSSPQKPCTSTSSLKLSRLRPIILVHHHQPPAPKS